jgi:hypothetical protein
MKDPRSIHEKAEREETFPATCSGGRRPPLQLASAESRASAAARWLAVGVVVCILMPSAPALAQMRVPAPAFTTLE